MKTPRRKQEKVDIKVQFHPPIQLPIVASTLQTGRRIKVNFMVNIELLKILNQYVPQGEKSDFVNAAVAQALQKYTQKDAMDFMNRVRESGRFQMTAAEIRKARQWL